MRIERHNSSVILSFPSFILLEKCIYIYLSIKLLLGNLEIILRQY